MKDIVPDDLQVIVELAPFLSQDALVSLVDRISSTEKLEMSWMERIIPFLKKDSANKMVKYLEPEI